MIILSFMSFNISSFAALKPCVLSMFLFLVVGYTSMIMRNDHDYMCRNSYQCLVALLEAVS